MKKAQIKRARQFMYMQDCDHLKVKKDDIKEILEKSGADEWAYIVHDQDETRVHIHVVLKFKNPHSIEAVAKLFDDKAQYVDIWNGRIANAYSYLIHETATAKEEGKHHYKATDVVASFDFPARIDEINQKVKQSPKEISKLIDEYADEKISKNELQEKIGVLNFAKRKNLIDKIDAVLAYKKHQEFLKEYEGEKCKVFWLWGKAGTGKSRLSREIFQSRHSNDFFVAGSARDHFQNYEGQKYIIINDLRPSDYNYGSLLTMLDPYELDKSASSRYFDKPINALIIIITTPYSPQAFYNNAQINDTIVDSFDQLKRRIQAILVTKDNYEQVKQAILYYDALETAIIETKRKIKHTRQDNA